MPKKSYKKKHLTSFQLIILGFAGVILLGSVLLMLPFSSVDKIPTPFHEALFTATSAVCVTGLVVKDTGSYWSLAGQTIILVLIQIGGLGVVTVAASVSLLSGKKISLMQRSTLQDAISAPDVYKRQGCRLANSDETATIVNELLYSSNNGDRKSVV